MQKLEAPTNNTSPGCGRRGSPAGGYPHTAPTYVAPEQITESDDAH